MQCYSELLPPTAVSHAIALPFLASDAKNLVVAKTSLLQIFTIERTAEGDYDEERLVLVGEYSLAGTVVDIAPVRLLDTPSGGHAVLISLKDAKLSLVEWDPDNHRISTISIHFYEGENITAQPFGPDLADCESILTVDPNSRCAALKFGARQLAILPFRQFGDDLVGDEEDGFEAEQKKEQAQNKVVDGDAEQTPYKSSFVLPLTTLDPSLTHTIHLAFLHEYREPTFGILSSSIAPSDGLLAERKDILTYTVFTLDLEQRASTNLVTVSKLPSSLWKVIPLPSPIGGALLVGYNEFVHVDQSGKTNAVAVNEFAKLESAFGMVDQSELNIRLEDCEVEGLDSGNGDLLVVLRDGTLVILSFEMLGRSIGALKVSRIPSEDGGDIMLSQPSCVARVKKNFVFIGSEDGPSRLIGWATPTAIPSRKRSHAQMVDQNNDDDEEDAEEEDDDDDDLYQAAPVKKKRAGSNVVVGADGILNYHFTKQSVIPSLAPMNHICLGRSHGAGHHKLELLASTGRGSASQLAILTRNIRPDVVRTTDLETVRSTWNIRVLREEDTDSNDKNFNNLLFAYDGSDTKVYDIMSSDDGDVEYNEHAASEFEQDGETLEINTLAQDTRIVQCKRSEIRIYDASLGLSQIIPMVDDETDVEYNVVHISFCDPYMLVVRDDKSVVVLQVQKKEIEPLEGEGAVAEKKWLSGCVYTGPLTNGKHTLFLLSSEGNFASFSLPDLRQTYVAPGLSLLPPVISADAAQRRTGVRESLTELLVADIGLGTTTKPYVMLRTAMDDLILYEHFHHPAPSTSSDWHVNVRFRKVPCTYIPKYQDEMDDIQDDRSLPLKPMRIGDYATVCIPEVPPSLILREPAFPPQILEIQGAEKFTRNGYVLPVHHPNSENGFMTISGSGFLVECRLPKNTWYGTGWAVRQTNLGGLSHDVRHLSFHEERGLYVVSTSSDADFYFPPEDGRHQEQDDISMRPQIPRCMIHLVSSRTNDVIDSSELPYSETVTAVKVMLLEVSENTFERKPRIVVSTAALRGEDMPAKGALMVFDVIDVVPEPGRPESGVKLHLVSREETKGAITAIDAFPGGLIGTTQGQKVMIRGLKEDGSCLPVAFLDAQCHMTSLKSLGPSGLWLLGDAWKGLWFGGFVEEPYKLTVLGKSRTHLEVVAADFLPFDGQLFLLLADANMDLHVLQYDPENPKTVSGMRLLHRSTFHLGHFPTTLTLLPSTISSTPDNAPTSEYPSSSASASSTPQHVLTTSQSGSIGLITPLDEASYRRLSALHTHLATVLEHAAALNPRAYRAAETEGAVANGGGGARAVVDGTLIRRIVELGATRRADVLGRAGGDAWTLRADLDLLSGGGLGYL